jgi:hypothetical protein
MFLEMFLDKLFETTTSRCRVCFQIELKKGIHRCTIGSTRPILSLMAEVIVRSILEQLQNC